MDGLYYWWLDTALLETMRAEIVDTADVHDAWRRCLDAIAGIAPDGEPHPATVSLYRDLTGRHAKAG